MDNFVICILSQEKLQEQEEVTNIMSEIKESHHYGWQGLKDNKRILQAIV